MLLLYKYELNNMKTYNKYNRQKKMKNQNLKI